MGTNKKSKCCQRSFVWLVMTLCAVLALVLLTAY
jgi:hypothetical protein